MTTAIDVRRLARRGWPYRVGPSDIHGMGVIAVRPIRRGELVSTEVKLLDKRFAGFNHSCGANLGDREYGTGHRHRKALRGIRPGEELTLDYQSVAARFGLVYTFEMGCNCPVCARCR